MIRPYPSSNALNRETLPLDRELGGMVGTVRGPDLTEMDLWAGREWDSVVMREYGLETVMDFPVVVPVFTGGRRN